MPMLKTHGLFVYKVFPYDLTLSYNTSVTDDDDRQTDSRQLYHAT